MDIHKPKPWHGVREFLKEYVIIVVGVLTALAAEQGVEWLHWRHQAQVAQVRIADEIEQNLRAGYARVMLQKCYDARLVELRDRLLASSGAWEGMPVRWTAPPGSKAENLPGFFRGGLLSSSVPPVYITRNSTWPDSAWSSAISSGVTLHLNSDRAGAFARLYSDFAQQRDIQNDEGQIQARLSPLSLTREVSPADRTRYMEMIGELNFLNVKAATFGRQAIAAANGSGVRIKASTARKEIAYSRADPRFTDCMVAEPIPLAGG